MAAYPRKGMSLSKGLSGAASASALGGKAISLPLIGAASRRVSKPLPVLCAQAALIQIQMSGVSSPLCVKRWCGG